MITMAKYKLSPSALKLFEECPRCFWLTQNDIWKRPSTIFPSLPNGMDKILKNHFDRFMEKGLLPPELCENKHCENLKLFNDKKQLEIWRNIFKGVSWIDEDGNNLHGAVDNILVNGKKLIVLDYKTRGYPLKEDTSALSQNQLDIYNFLLRKEGRETEDYSFLLFYIPKEVTEKGEVIFDTELVKMKVDIKNAENIWNNAIELLNGDCPMERCKWCKLIN